jgi:putative methionine-R-sulfoxide reductase with GAF domain
MVGPLTAVRSETPWRAQAISDDHDLRDSLAALSQLGTAGMEFTDVLTRIAEIAAVATPGADGVGLTLVEARHAETIVASAPFVAEVEAVQLDVDEGPCITAISEARAVYSGSLSSDDQWPRFGAQASELGVHSALSVPLRTTGDVLGAINVYSHEYNAFDRHAVVIGELFAVPAAISVHNAQVLAHAQRVAAQLEIALTHRATIDQAIGILIARSACTADEASDVLREMARRGGEDLPAIALRLVDDAVRRIGREPDSAESAPARQRDVVPGTDASGLPVRARKAKTHLPALFHRG